MLNSVVHKDAADRLTSFSGLKIITKSNQEFDRIIIIIKSAPRYHDNIVTGGPW